MVPWTVTLCRIPPRDDRIPVRFFRDAGGEGDPACHGRGAAWLIEGDAPAPAGAAVARYTAPLSGAHAPGCRCCAARSSAAVALGRLFLARARGEVAPFDHV